MRSTVLNIFLAALVIRWGYSIALYLAMGDAGLGGVDSPSYIDAGTVFAAEFKSGALTGWRLLGPNPYMMPLHAWLCGFAALLGGPYAALCNVLLQGLFDAGTCVLVYGMAQAIDPRYATPAAVAAIINPTQIVMAGMVYPDTPFVFFVALILFAALRWLRTPSWGWTLLIAAALAASAWTRILVLPFALALVVFLPLATAIAGRFHKRQLVQLGGALAIFVICLVPISLRNAAAYGSWSLTPQTGIHLARWVVPLIWEVHEHRPWADGYAEIERRAAALPRVPDENTFQQSQRYTKVAMEELQRLPVAAVVKGWLFGAALNLGTPAIVQSPAVARLPRTGFYATQGPTITDKVVNYLFRSDNALYAWILLAGISGLLLVRLLQLAGVAAMLWHGQWAAVLLLSGWCLFILGVNGPVASPKYRLPMEPALVILTGAGWALLRGRRKASAQNVDE